MAIGPNTTGRFQAGEPQRCCAAAYSLAASGESEPPKSVWLPVNSLLPAPEPLAVLFSVWPGKACSNALTKGVHALAWPVDPVAWSVFSPPQFTEPDHAPLLVLPPPV